MAKIEELLNSIKAVLDNVDGITGSGRVRLFPQRTITQEDFEATFQVHLNDKRPINAWIIRWDGASNTRVGATLNSYWRDYSVTVIGFISFNNESDLNLMNIAENILDTFGPKMTLGLTDVPVPGAPTLFESSIVLTEFDHGMLGPVLCSTATFKITAKEWKGIVTFT